MSTVPGQEDAMDSRQGFPNVQGVMFLVKNEQKKLVPPSRTFENVKS